MITIAKRFRRTHSHRDPEASNTSDESDTFTGISPPVCADALLKKKPLLKDQICSALLYRADCSGTWHQRRAILTNESLILCRDDHDYICDEIQLKSIEAISTVNAEDQPSTGASNLSKGSSIRHDRIDFCSENIPDHSSGSVLGRRSRILESSSMTQSFGKVLGTKDELGSGYPFYVFVKAGEIGSTIRYQLRTQSKQVREEFLASLLIERDKYVMSANGATFLSRLQSHLARLYHQYIVSGLMAGLIIANFIVDIAEAELCPQRGSRTFLSLRALDVAFTTAFGLDLLVNIAAHGLRNFTRRGEENQSRIKCRLAKGSLLLD
jgi:hypothetical protein